MTRKLLLAATILMTPWASEARPPHGSTSTGRLWPERFWSGWRWSREPGPVCRPSRHVRCADSASSLRCRRGRRHRPRCHRCVGESPSNLVGPRSPGGSGPGRPRKLPPYVPRRGRGRDATRSFKERAAYLAMQDLLHEGQGRTIHFHWLENGSVYPVPGQPLPPLNVVDATYQRALLETDYAGPRSHPKAFRAGDA
ncbi:MAG: hypothetical protein Ct9H300mP15_13880 [Gemmatimonadota bacterium]|nr:MAG: hypothetical protein Ct9H300mP15_13880 [Gemmatimonadota bacterium]